MSGTSFLNKEIQTRIKSEKIALLCRQYETLLGAGIEALPCTRMLAGQTRDKRLARILSEVCRDVDGGHSLASSFEKRGGKSFSSDFYEAIKAGESSGSLRASFEYLADYYKKQSKISKQIKSALIYPAFVLATAVIVLIVVMVYVMPKLTGIFENMGGDIPGITRVIINISDFFSNNILVIALALVLLVAALILAGRTPRGRLRLDSLKIALPLFGKIMKNNYFAQFSTTLAMLQSSGLVLTRSLEICSKIVNNQVFSNAIVKVLGKVKGGRPFGRSMKQEPCFPETCVDMISVGEETGELARMLSISGEYARSQADEAIKRLLTALEPAMLIFVAFIAGFIVFAIYIPLFQMYDLF